MTENSQPSLRRFIATMLVGIGLIAIGIMLLLLLNDPAFSASVQDLSAVPARVDFAAPELNLQTLSGESASLADYRGKVVLVNLWATWCPPCKAEMPTLNAFYQKYQADGFVLLAVNQEESRDVVALFVDQMKLSFPVWLDEAGDAEPHFNTMNLPSSYVVDRNGRVRLSWVGSISAKNLEQYVPDVIKE